MGSVLPRSFVRSRALERRYVGRRTCSIGIHGSDFLADNSFKRFVCHFSSFPRLSFFSLPGWTSGVTKVGSLPTTCLHLCLVDVRSMLGSWCLIRLAMLKARNSPEQQSVFRDSVVPSFLKWEILHVDRDWTTSKRKATIPHSHLLTRTSIWLQFYRTSSKHVCGSAVAVPHAFSLSRSWKRRFY